MDLPVSNLVIEFFRTSSAMSMRFNSKSYKYFVCISGISLRYINSPIVLLNGPVIPKS